MELLLGTSLDVDCGCHLPRLPPPRSLIFPNELLPDPLTHLLLRQDLAGSFLTEEQACPALRCGCVMRAGCRVVLKQANIQRKLCCPKSPPHPTKISRKKMIFGMLRRAITHFRTFIFSTSFEAQSGPWPALRPKGSSQGLVLIKKTLCIVDRPARLCVCEHCLGRICLKPVTAMVHVGPPYAQHI